MDSADLTLYGEALALAARAKQNTAFALSCHESSDSWTSSSLTVNKLCAYGFANLLFVRGRWRYLATQIKSSAGLSVGYVYVYAHVKTLFSEPKTAIFGSALTITIHKIRRRPKND